MIDLAVFEKNIGFDFHNKFLLQQAFTHSSSLATSKRDKRSLKKHNERLEYLGDAVLTLVTAEYLFMSFPDRNEGELTLLRSSLVNTATLSRVAEDLSLHHYLVLSQHDERERNRLPPSILANTFEAVVGVMYLDQGHDVVRMFLEKTLFSLLPGLIKAGLDDAKGVLQTQSLKHFDKLPRYRVVAEAGPSNGKFFTIEVLLRGKVVARGQAPAKKDAEKAAAQNALDIMGWK